MQTLLRPRRRVAAFTLVEMTVALVVLSVGVLAIWNVFSAATWASQHQQRVRTALLLGESMLAEISLIPPRQFGRESGHFEPPHEGFLWVREVQSGPADSLAQIVVRVYWNERGSQRSIVLATLERM